MKLTVVALLGLIGAATTASVATLRSRAVSREPEEMKAAALAFLDEASDVR